MKRRIIAAVLAAVVACNLITLRPKAAAAGGVAAIITIGVCAWQLIGVMTGQYDDVADAIGVLVESGVDGITNSDSPFQQNWRTGWQSMCNTISGWVDSGTAIIDDDGKLHLTYSQYNELYGQSVGLMSKPSVEFTAGYDCQFLDVDLSAPVAFSSLPRYEMFFDTATGQSYAPVYYNDETLVFGAAFVWQSHTGRDYKFMWQWVKTLRPSITNGWLPGFTANADSYAVAIADHQPVFWATYNTLYDKHFWVGNFEQQQAIDTCWVFSDGALTATPVADIDFTTLNGGLLTTTGDYPAFLQSVTGYNPTTIAPDMDELSDVLPLDKTTNPGLVVDSDPSIVLPTDAVTVTDVPGVGDATLSEYMADTKTDIDVPSIIMTKFPFCIPFDFYNIISTLCADPVAPVFRIPISTNPDNLQGFEGNQTIGNYLPDDNYKPLFEIDEEIIIDLSVLPLVQPICYTIFIVGFIVLLIMLTPKLIQH